MAGLKLSRLVLEDQTPMRSGVVWAEADDTVLAAHNSRTLHDGRRAN